MPGKLRMPCGRVNDAEVDEASVEAGNMAEPGVSGARALPITQTIFSTV